MNIVLSTVHAAKENLSDGTLPTVGLLYVAASVAGAPGVTVTVADPLAEGLALESAADKIAGFRPDLLGLYVTSSNVRRGLNLISLVKSKLPHVKTIVGGPHATLFDDLLLREAPDLDFAFRGEAEESFPILTQRLMRGESIEGTPGLSPLPWRGPHFPALPTIETQ